MSELPTPTLKGMLDIAAQWQADRLTMVRQGPPVRMREPGVFVLMIGSLAIREIGPICIEAAGKVCDEKSSPFKEGDLQPDDSLDQWFNEMEQRKIYFTWGQQRDPELMFTFFLGGELVDWLAPRLNERGCLCQTEL